jgi:hypothetical protein
LLQKSAYRRAAGGLEHFFEAIHCHPLDGAGEVIPRLQAAGLGRTTIDSQKAISSNNRCCPRLRSIRDGQQDPAKCFWLPSLYVFIVSVSCFRMVTIHQIHSRCLRFMVITDKRQA